MDELIQPVYTEPNKSPSFSPNDGWHIMPRVHRYLRWPGARHSFDCDDCDDCDEYEYPYEAVPVEDSRLDRYVASKFPGWRYGRRHGFMMELFRLADDQRKMLGRAEWIVNDDMYAPPLCRHARRRSKDPFKFCMNIRDAVLYVCSDWDEYAQNRMEMIKVWFQCDFKQMPTPEQQRQFEKEAWYWDRHHKLALAARRRLARVVVGRLLRIAVKHRMIALYWQEQTQRALCAPGGAGRAADAVAFESEFAQ